MNFSPKSITITEDNPETVSSFRISVKTQDNVTELASGVYPITGNSTTIPIGSNGLFDPIPDGTFVNLFVLEIAAPDHGDNGPEQPDADNPHKVTTLCNGAESFLVTG